METQIPFRLLVSTPVGPVPLTPERSQVPLPQGPDPEGVPLAYGPYLQSLARFLAADAFEPLRSALEQHLGRPVPVEAIGKTPIEIISEKHGAFYNVARIRVPLSGTVCSLAVNVAVRPEQHAFLENEFSLLTDLHRRFGLPFLPRPYLMGDIPYGDPSPSSSLLLKLFLTEWFDEFHEFHLSEEPGNAGLAIRVWDRTEEGRFLTAEETRALYRQAAAILTGYLDETTFQQVYPWHHAAGDFIVKRSERNVALRLITARDYRRLDPSDATPEEPWIAIIHFFLNLTLRMRLDRLDGTGELVWADSASLESVLAGFLEAWAAKARKTSLPPAEDVLGLLRSLSSEEWIDLAEIVMEQGLIEADEEGFLRSKLREHVSALTTALQQETP